LPQIQEEDRRRIARTLHDTVGQSIAALQMNLAILAESRQKFEPGEQKALADSLALALTCVREIRSLSYDLYPPLLDESGLLAGLRGYFGDYSQRTGINVDLTLPNRLSRFPREIEIGLFRIAQEAVASIHRLSQAPTTLRIQRKVATLILELNHQGNLETDDLDLAGVRERARLLGSKLRIESTADSLILRLILPTAEKFKAS
jgi:two-component system, NarL family, sensor kinase